jgi:hypothetical protein
MLEEALEVMVIAVPLQHQVAEVLVVIQVQAAAVLLIQAAEAEVLLVQAAEGLEVLELLLFVI